ncbi:MAG: carbohydrate ABC transporter permease [Alphaproteobacteria bacterium]|nr:carbohydrate ABC transporter permease [Alphaproteobacteria bacterium]
MSVGTATHPAAGKAPTIAGEKKHTRYIVAAVCIFLIALMLFPVFMSLLASIKTPAEAMAAPPTYLPHALSLDNYFKVYDYQVGLPVYLFNSLAVAFLTIVFCLVLAVPAAYGLARFPVPGKEILFVVLLLGLMIPYQALVTPLYLMFSKIGLSNSLVGLALIHTIVQLPFSVFLLRNSFEAIPKALEEAAVTDGCNSWQTLWRVFLPLVKAGIVTVVLFAFIASWNEFLGALIFMSRESNFTIPIMLVNVRTGQHGAIDWGALQAGVVIAVLPCIAIYVLLQKYYMSGFLSGAVK